MLNQSPAPVSDKEDPTVPLRLMVARNPRNVVMQVSEHFRLHTVVLTVLMRYVHCRLYSVARMAPEAQRSQAVSPAHAASVWSWTPLLRAGPESVLSAEGSGPRCAAGQPVTSVSAPSSLWFSLVNRVAIMGMAPIPVRTKSVRCLCLPSRPPRGRSSERQCRRRMR